MTLTYPVMCRLALFVAPRDHNLWCYFAGTLARSRQPQTALPLVFYLRLLANVP